MVLPIRKVLTSLGKIAKQLRSCEPIVAKNGQALTKRQKTVNFCFKALDKSCMPLLITTGAGTTASIFSVGYADITDNEKLLEPSLFATFKGFDTFLGTALGFLAGGPIGAWIGAGLAYSTDYSILGSLLAISEDFTIEDSHTDMARIRQITYDSVKELLGFNKSEEVTTTTEDKTRQPETAPQKTDNKIKFTNKDTNEEIEYEFGWIYPNKNMTLTNSKGETFTLEKDITYFVEQDGTIKEYINRCYLTPDGDWFGGSVCINDPYTQDHDKTIKTANGGIYETKKGDIVTYLKDGSLKVEKPLNNFLTDENGNSHNMILTVGETYTANEILSIIGKSEGTLHCQTGTEYPIKLEAEDGKLNKFYINMDGSIIAVTNEDESQLAKFTISDSDNQFIQKTGQYFCANKDMNLTDKYGIKYSIEEGDTYICDDSGKIIIKYTAGWQYPKEDIVLNGTFGQVTVKAGNAFCPYNNSLKVHLGNDATIIDKNGKEYNAQAEDSVIYNNDGTISIEKVMGTSNDGAYNLIVGEEYVADIATTMTDYNGIKHTINVGDKYFCDENGALTVIPKGSQISFRRIGKGAQPLELAVGERYIAEENMKLLVGRNNNLVSVNLNDTLVCKSDSTLDVRHFVPQVQKVSIRKIGTPTPVEYEVGKTYTADKETRLLVGTNNQLVTIKAGQNFKVNADKTVSIVNGN